MQRQSPDQSPCESPNPGISPADRHKQSKPSTTGKISKRRRKHKSKFTEEQPTVEEKDKVSRGKKSNSYASPNPSAAYKLSESARRRRANEGKSEYINPDRQTLTKKSYPKKKGSRQDLSKIDKISDMCSNHGSDRKKTSRESKLKQKNDGGLSKEVADSILPGLVKPISTLEKKSKNVANHDPEDEKGKDDKTSEIESGKRQYSSLTFSPKREDTAKQWAAKILANGIEREGRKELTLSSEYKPAETKFEKDKVKAFKENPDLNRYGNMFCLEESRVKMPPPFNYYHANHVRGEHWKREFICAQGPATNTNESFWRLILHHDVRNIVMLCELIEKNVEKCSAYFPQEIGDVKTFGNITIEKTTTHEMIKAKEMKVIVSTFIVKCPEKASKIMHYHCLNWKDHGVPNDFLTPIRILYTTDDYPSPCLVHCSAGVGRTGTLVLIWSLLEQLRNGVFAENNFTLLQQIRSQRAQAVQNEIQYVYAFRCVIEYMAEKGIIEKDEKFEAFCKEFESLLKNEKDRRKSRLIMQHEDKK